MSAKLLLRVRPEPAALAKMRSSRANFPGPRWAAYENHDLGHWGLGHLQFLAVGPQNTLKVAPTRLPPGTGGRGACGGCQSSGWQLYEPMSGPGLKGRRDKHRY